MPEFRARLIMRGLQLLSLALFAGLMTAAAFDDLRRLIISNRLTATLGLLWPAHFLTGEPSWPAALAALIAAATVFAGGALLFARGWLGGGDVKLLSAAALWAGGAAVPALLVLTALFGGALAVLVLSPLGAQIAAVRASPAASPARRPVPYGAAIAAAALVVVVGPSFA
jgi:prepilin peptidase CpaA